MVMIQTSELILETGATFRQVDYWCRYGVIPTIGEHLPGSGINRKFNNEIIPRVKILVKVSKAMGGRVDINILKTIYKNFGLGFVELSDNVVLSWRV